MKVPEKQIFEIIKKCISAPSGDNCQPWSFEWDGQELHIFHNSIRAKHPLNIQEMASKLSLGCLLEAIDIAASEFQLKSEYVLEDTALSSKELNLWAKVKFTKTNKLSRNLQSDDLLLRSTDRRLYQGGDLSRAQLNEVDSFSPAKFHLLPKPSQKLLNYVVEAEQYLIASYDILPETLNWVHFTKKQAKASRDGMYWRNMEIRFWELPMIPFLREFPIVLKIFRPVLRFQNEMRVKRQLNSSAGLVCVSIPTIDFSDVIAAGRLMMTIWITLNQKGYGVQPLTISSLCMLCVRLGIVQLPKRWSDLFREGEAILREEFSIASDMQPVWMIRTGRSTLLPAELRTLRMPVEHILKMRNSAKEIDK